MKGKIITTLCIATLAIAGCKKESTNNNTTADATLEQSVLTDFAAVVANPNYQEIQAKALILNNAIIAFNTTPNDANLVAAQVAWKNTRAAWESCEGFFIWPG